MNAARVLHFGNSWFTSKQREWALGMRSSVRARVAFNSACLSFSVPEATQKRDGIRAAFFYMDVTTERLNRITELCGSGTLVTDVGTVLPLAEAPVAHEMLGGVPHKRGKIVLSVAA